MAAINLLPVEVEISSDNNLNKTKVVDVLGVLEGKTPKEVWV